MEPSCFQILLHSNFANYVSNLSRRAQYLILFLEKWEWQDEYHNWNEYSDHVNTLLNAGKLCGLKTVEFSVKGAQYQVNLIKQEQANKNTKVRRKVRITGDDDDNGKH